MPDGVQDVGMDGVLKSKKFSFSGIFRSFFSSFWAGYVVGYIEIA